MNLATIGVVLTVLSSTASLVFHIAAFWPASSICVRNNPTKNPAGSALGTVCRVLLRFDKEGFHQQECSFLVC